MAKHICEACADKASKKDEIEHRIDIDKHWLTQPRVRLCINEACRFNDCNLHFDRMQCSFAEIEIDKDGTCLNCSYLEGEKAKEL